MPRFKVLCDDQGHRFYRTVISFDRKTAMRDAVVLTYSTAIDATEVDENGIEISTEPAASEVQQGGKEDDFDGSVQFELDFGDRRIRVNCPDEDSDIYIQVRRNKQYAGLSLTLDQAEAVANYILGHVNNARLSNK